MKATITEESKVILVNLYNEFMKLHQTKYGDECNKWFFRFARTHELFSELKDNQMRMILVNRGVYKPTNPRVEPKKKGVAKGDLIAQLRDLCDDQLTDSILKINMQDLEILIARISSAS